MSIIPQMAVIQWIIQVLIAKAMVGAPNAGITRVHLLRSAMTPTELMSHKVGLDGHFENLPRQSPRSGPSRPSRDGRVRVKTAHIYLSQTTHGKRPTEVNVRDRARLICMHVASLVCSLIR